MVNRFEMMSISMGNANPVKKHFELTACHTFFMCQSLTLASAKVDYYKNDMVSLPPWKGKCKVCPVAGCNSICLPNSESKCGSCGEGMCAAHAIRDLSKKHRLLFNLHISFEM